MHLYFRALQVLKVQDRTQEVSVKEALFKKSKTNVIVNGSKRMVSEVPENSHKIADMFMC